VLAATNDLTYVHTHVPYRQNSTLDALGGLLTLTQLYMTVVTFEKTNGSQH